MDGRGKGDPRRLRLAFTSNACLVVGLFICLAASRFVGMPIWHNPAAALSAFAMWVIAIGVGYRAFTAGPRAPRPDAPFWVKVCGYLAAQSSFFSPWP